MNLALNPFDKGKKPEKVDEVEIERYPVLEDIVKRFEKMREHIEGHFPNTTECAVFNRSWFYRFEDGPFDNQQLQILMHLITGKYAGCLLSKYIQDSVEAGHKDLVLYCNEPLSAFIYKIRNANIEIHGDVGEYSCVNCEYCNFKINGSAGPRFGKDSKQCTFYVESVEEDCGSCSHNCKYHISGSAGKYLGTNSERSRFYVLGDVGERCGNNSNNSGFDIKGSAGMGLAVVAKKSIFVVEGSIHSFSKNDCCKISWDKEKLRKEIEKI